VKDGGLGRRTLQKATKRSSRESGGFIGRGYGKKVNGTEEGGEEADGGVRAKGG